MTKRRMKTISNSMHNHVKKMSNYLYMNQEEYKLFVHEFWELAARICEKYNLKLYCIEEYAEGMPLEFWENNVICDTDLPVISTDFEMGTDCFFYITFEGNLSLKSINEIRNLLMPSEPHIENSYHNWNFYTFYFNFKDMYNQFPGKVYLDIKR